MTQNSRDIPSLRLHLTNVTGAGATHLLQSLLPAFEHNKEVMITEIHLPDHGELASYQKISDNCLVKVYRRWLPNSISRLLECLVFSRSLNCNVPLLVLGDLPLRCRAPQTVFVQTSHMCQPKHHSWNFNGLKFSITRLVFRLNIKYAQAFIVQTSVMRDTLADSYPSIANKIHVIAQPVPSWLLNAEARRSRVAVLPNKNLKLIYPAANYPHKNHKLLAEINIQKTYVWPIEKLKLTVNSKINPAQNIEWIECVGFLATAELIKAYHAVDGLLFLSTDESYGFPLVEAMYLGIPIVCPDLPYAHTICADGAIYFDPYSIDSLKEAVDVLYVKLAEGWWPDWSKQLMTIPKDWNIVASQMIEVACHCSKCEPQK